MTNTVTDNTVVPIQRNRFSGLTFADINSAEADKLVLLALEILSAKHQPGTTLSEPSLTERYLQLQWAGRTAEVFGCIFLDTKLRAISFEEMFHGTIDSTQVYPRVVVQRALAVNAFSVIFAHNHPSGDEEPSCADISLTKRLKEALALVDIQVLDHIVVGVKGVTSFAKRGLI